MGRFALAALLLSSAAHADDASGVMRPLAGVSLSGSDSGGGFGLQLGLRLSSVLLRGTLDIGGVTGPRGYVSISARGDWLQPVGNGAALLVGMGIARITYGFIFDDPVEDVSALTPEVGVLFGPDRRFGRILVGLTGFVPLGSPPVSSREPISAPQVMITLLLSL